MGTERLRDSRNQALNQPHTAFLLISSQQLLKWIHF